MSMDPAYPDQVLLGVAKSGQSDGTGSRIRLRTFVSVMKSGPHKEVYLVKIVEVSTVSVRLLLKRRRAFIEPGHLGLPWQVRS
jgi:hypothetical protein